VDPSKCTVRRANLEDLPNLKGLWEVAGLPPLELEKHLTEFQVVSRADGILQGALAVRLAGTQALIHSEAYYSSAGQEEWRSALCDRLLVLARNHGVARLWMRGAAEAWLSLGFRPATSQELQKLPPAFGLFSDPWLTLRLREETALAGQLERELELYQIAERERSQRLMRQARVAKWIAALIAVGFLSAALALMLRILWRSRSNGRR
jgi:N-acetylglutamate synthase-like GNAT family acetyltransferase